MTYRSFAAASLLIAAALYPNLVSAQTMRGQRSNVDQSRIRAAECQFRPSVCAGNRFRRHGGPARQPRAYQ
jgi:hypothetical protein